MARKKNCKNFFLLLLLRKTVRPQHGSCVPVLLLF